MAELNLVNRPIHELAAGLAAKEFSAAELVAAYADRVAAKDGEIKAFLKLDREQALKAAVEGLKPFGNDRFLLHTVETPALGRHSIYWDPEATLNWRQRRNSLRRKERAAANALRVLAE